MFLIKLWIGDFLFGYLKPLKPEMKIKDYETYRGVYCGMCREIGKNFGQLSRLTLSYDFAFLALLELSVQPHAPCFKAKHCALHPFHKRICCQSCAGLSYTSCAAILMVYYKIKDDYDDGGFFTKITSAFLLAFASGARKKAIKLHPELDTIIGEAIKKQTALETAKCDSIDTAADPIATALAEICKTFSPEQGQKRVLYQLGYYLGRWIYLIDAFDDLSEDLKSGNYNPFVVKYALKQGDENISLVKESAVPSLNLTLGEIANAFQLLNISQYGEILENIIYMGLPNVQTLINTPKRSRNNDRSL